MGAASGTLNTGNNSVNNSAVACFLPKTKVLTKSGYKDIEKIKIGDQVLSYNTETKKSEYSKVIKTFEHINTNDTLYSLTINDKVLKVTALHPFYIKLNNNLGYGWIYAKDLKVGNLVITSDGKYYEITNIEFKIVTDNFYNIEVENNHNYYVTEDNILVHNKR